MQTHSPAFTCSSLGGQHENVYGTPISFFTSSDQLNSTAAHSSTMTIESRADNTNDTQYHKKRRIYFALGVTSVVVSSLIVCYIIVRGLKYRSRSRIQSSQVVLPRWRTEVLPEIDGQTQPCIPLQEIVVDRADPPECPASPQQHCALLNLPAELRLQIYSYLIPNVQVSRTLRQTCRQIDHEVEHEARKAFTRELTSLQKKVMDGETQLATVFYSAAAYHVEVVLEPPQLYFTRSLPQPVQHAQNLTDAIALSCVGLCPLNTRSITITLQPYPQTTLSSFQYYFDDTWTILENHFNRVVLNDAKEGKTDLRKITVICGQPAILVPQRKLGGIRRKLEWITILGVSFRCGKDFQCIRSFVLDSRQKYLGLAVKLLDLGKGTADQKIFMQFTE